MWTRGPQNVGEIILYCGHCKTASHTGVSISYRDPAECGESIEDQEATWRQILRDSYDCPLCGVRNVNEDLEAYVEKMRTLDQLLRKFDRRLQGASAARNVGQEVVPDVRPNLFRYGSSELSADWERWDPAYQGLYMALQRAFGQGWWRYVPNPRGGFWAFWWGMTKVDRAKVYLQLEEEKLVVKVSGLEDDQRRHDRDILSNQVLAVLKPLGFKRPDRIRHGKTMTIAELGEDYRACGETGLLDLVRTVALLRQVTTALTGLAQT